jgi:hypothetical protein
MTNREWLNSLTDNKLLKIVGHNSLCNYIQDCYALFCENNAVCRGCLKKWLATEHTEPKESEE